MMHIVKIYGFVYNNEEVLIWWLKTQLFPEILAGMGVQAPQQLLRAPHQLLRAPHQLFQAPHLVPCALRCFVQALHLLLSIPQLGIQNLRSEPLQ
jgi:predicted alpha/beta hydrolase